MPHRYTDFLMDPVPDQLWRDKGAPVKLRLGHCEECGFIHASPYPPADYLASYYSQYEMPTSQANLAETARFLAGSLAKDAQVIDMGCGDGAFLAEMHKLGYEHLIGFDQGPGVERAKARHFGQFYSSSAAEFIGQAKARGGTDADAIVMVNVLEHVPEPLDLLRGLGGVLKEDALLCIVVPNDFSPLQQAFLKVKGHLPWFVCLPDHLNYFNFESLSRALDRCGFEITDQSALYPLELFLLQDLDYIADPSLGPVAHGRRVQFEQNMKQAGMEAELDHFYRTLAKGGYGRDLMVLARRKAGMKQL